MKTLTITGLLAFMLGFNFTYATVLTDIEAANKAGKTVFLVVTDKAATGTEKVVEIARQAQLKFPQSVVLKMDRLDAENAPFVSKYRLGSAPVPLLLVVATNGIVAAGFTPDQATPDALVNAIPSPKKADVQKYLSQGKSVFIVVTNKSMATKDNVMNTCQQACIEMENNAKMIEISLDDPKEKKFLADLKVNLNATEPMTYVINTKGQVTGTFNDDVNAAELVASAKKVAAPGCCPPGSGKTCGPTKK